MPDIADAHTAFQEAKLRAEEAAGITRDANGNEVYAEVETPVVPELEGAVPVAASDQLPVEPPVVPEVTPTEQLPQEPQSPEALQAEIARLQEQLANKDSFIGRQSTDVGTLRAEVDALRAQITTPQTPQAQPVVITQELIESNPARAAQLAFQQNDAENLATAFEAWRAEDEFTAGQWLTDRRLEKQSAEFDAKLAEVRGEVQQVAAPIAATAETATWSTAFVEMQKVHPDFLALDEATGKTNAQRLLEEVAPQFPVIAKLIAEGDVDAKVEGLTLLYEKSRLGNPAQVQAELQSAADDAAASAAAARAAAASVNGQGTAGQGSAVEQTEEQKEVEQYKERMTRKASLARGWTGRSA